MRPEAGEQRQLLAAHSTSPESDWDHSDPVEHATQVAAVDPPCRPGIGEALGAERETTRPGERELQRCHADGQSATAIVTELMTTSVFGRSPPLGRHALHLVDDLETLHHLTEQ